MRYFMLAVLTLAVTSAHAAAAIVLQSGDTSVWLRESAAWTPYEMEHAGRQYMAYTGSAQGTVISESGHGWAGSAHGREVVTATSILVDGVAASMLDGTTYTGGSVVFTRQTRLGESFTLHSTLRVENGRITESVQLSRADSTTNASVVYGFLGTRADRLTQAAGFDTSGLLVSQATTTSDDDAMPGLSPAVAVAQYDPIAGDGILSTITLGADLGLEHFIWDRSTDNKLYARFHGIQGVHPEGTTFAIRQTLRFFEADGDTWQSVASAMVPEPAALLPLALLGLLARRSHR